MAVTVTSLMSLLNGATSGQSDCETLTDWTVRNISGTMGLAALIQSSDEEQPPRQGTYCIGWDCDIETGGYYYAIASSDRSASLVYIWACFWAAATLEVSAPGTGQPGVFIMACDSSGNFGYWHVGGSDTYSGGWKCFVADLSKAPDTNSGTAPNLAQCTGIGIGFKNTAKSKAAHNAFIDFMRVTTPGNGIKVVTTSGSVATWDTVYTGSNAIAAGVLRKEGGVYFLQGPVQFGDNASGDMEFSDTNKLVVFDNTNINDGHYGISVVGSSGGIIKFQMGTKSGARGVQGCTINGGQPYTITASDVDIDELKLYGCTFYNAGTVSLPSYVISTREVIDCSFVACGEVLADTCTVTYCSFVNADNRGLRIASTSHHMSYCTFVACPHSLHFSVADSYTITGCNFYGADGATYYDIENSSSGGTVNISVVTSSAPPVYYENTAGGTTNISNDVALLVTCTNEAGIAVEGVRVRIEKASDGSLVSEGATDSSGEHNDTYNYTVEVPVNVIARLKGYKNSKASSSVVGTGLSVPFTLIRDTAVNLP